MKLIKFFDLGGHSLIATQIINRIHSIFNIKISLKSFFKSPTLLDTAKNMIEQHDNGSINEIIKMWLELDKSNPKLIDNKRQKVIY